jgi:hypothetical protein
LLVIGYSFVGGAHGSYTKLTLTVEITSATNGGPRCEPGVRGIVTLYDSAAKLSNGERSDYVVMGHWRSCSGRNPRSAARPNRTRRAGFSAVQ